MSPTDRVENLEPHWCSVSFVNHVEYLWTVCNPPTTAPCHPYSALLAPHSRFKGACEVSDSTAINLTFLSEIPEEPNGLKDQVDCRLVIEPALPQSLNSKYVDRWDAEISGTPRSHAEIRAWRQVEFFNAVNPSRHIRLGKGSLHTYKCTGSLFIYLLRGPVHPILHGFRHPTFPLEQ